MSDRSVMLITLLLVLMAGGSCRSDCELKMRNLVNLSTEHQESKYFSGQVHEFVANEIKYKAVRIAGGSTYIAWCDDGFLRWLRIFGHRGGNDLDSIDADNGLYGLKVRSHGSMNGHGEYFLIDGSSERIRVVLAVPCLLDGLTSWSPAESARHTVTLDYHRRELVERWRYSREGEPLDSGMKRIPLVRDKLTDVLHQDMFTLRNSRF